VVGALGVALAARAAGLQARVGGVTWERRPIDPIPGPRRLDELSGAEPIAPGVALAGPETSGPGGFRFAEAHMARFLGEPVVLVDPNGGPRAVGPALDAAAEHLGCDLVALVDVGGDVLATGEEPGLASPLCDAVLLAGARYMRTRTVGAVFGVGCDGELTPQEVLQRLSESRVLGAWGITPDEADVLERAVAEVPTEASAMAVKCARGFYGQHEIREGRRTVPLSPVGAVTFFFEPDAPLARVVADAADLDEADRRLADMGLRTEFAYEREHAAS
jgi:hypothetical protein